MIAGLDLSKMDNANIEINAIGPNLLNGLANSVNDPRALAAKDATTTEAKTSETSDKAN